MGASRTCARVARLGLGDLTRFDVIGVVSLSTAASSVNPPGLLCAEGTHNPFPNFVRHLRDVKGALTHGGAVDPQGFGFRELAQHPARA